VDEASRFTCTMIPAPPNRRSPGTRPPELPEILA
jgi:hypothetical protein